MAGRHRISQVAVRAATITTAAGAGLSVLGTAGADIALADQASETAWNAIVSCESAGRNVNNSTYPKSSASGYFQIIDSTWRENGGGEFSSRAIGASREQQQVVADRIYTRSGNSFRDWNASKSCWSGSVGSLAPVVHGSSAVPQPEFKTVAATSSTYRVVLGDSLVRIAAKTGTNWRDLAALNGLSAPYTIYPGNVLKLSGSQTPRTSEVVGGTTYTVRVGDTLNKIAQRHATSWQTLYSINRQVIGSNPAFILPGQVLTLPGDGTVVLPPPTSPPPATPVVPSQVSPTDRSCNGKLTPTSTDCAAWNPSARSAVAEITRRFGVSTVLTRPGHSPTGGRAADLMVYGDRAKGDAVAQYVIDNAARLGVDYVIWRQRIAGPWTGWAWRAMADRGSATANHLDHAHVSFRP